MTLVESLAAAIGVDSVVTDSARLSVLGHDVYHVGGLPQLAVRPTSVAALQSAVRLCAAAGVAIVPRGGGASYTDGYLLPAGGHVIIDTAALDTIDIDVPNAIVSVGPGVTWAALKAALAPNDLRTPFWGPFSGLFATVGGSISQNAVSHGSGTHGISAASVVSMDVVLASGELLTTGPNATRNYGPDLTGLFTGDCGALGIKANIRLPLIALRGAHEPLSFAFDNFGDFASGMAAAAREELADDQFGVDLALSQGQIGKVEGAASKIRMAGEVFRAAPGALSGLKQLARMAMAGDAPMRSGAYMGHFIVEGVDTIEAGARAARLRAVLALHNAREIANTVPGFVRAMPFAPFTNILGPAGERWVPLHGILPHAGVAAFHEALTTFYADRAADMERFGVWQGAMFSMVGSAGFLYEIALYWPDAQTPYHVAMLDADFLAATPVHAANSEASAYVAELKAALVALYAEHGAAHFQIGRAYSLRMGVEARALLAGIKAMLDPQNLMNPGVLGL